jgi:hypothetical protein
VDAGLARFTAVSRIAVATAVAIGAKLLGDSRTLSA